MPQTIVAGNWKMNLTPNQGSKLISDIAALLQNEINPNTSILFCVPFTHLQSAKEAIISANNPHFQLGAQNCYFQKSGAYTGEISIEMLQSFGVTHVLVGHSERRQIFNENNEMLHLKVDALIENNLTPVFCCGEPLEIREANTQNSYVESQLLESILHLDTNQIQKIVIAYEPIWAIGTGVTATSQQAQDMHSHIRLILENKYGHAVAASVSILYGGSCNPSNADELLALPDINGGLIGGAALKPDQFVAIIKAAK
jgi:triosephosphate isomerase (TIM)